jgi:hypothetical protein
MKKLLIVLIAASAVNAGAADFGLQGVKAGDISARTADLQPVPNIPLPPAYNPGWNNPGWNNNLPQYNFGGYRETCATLDFTSQSQLTAAIDMVVEEFGEECSFFNGLPSNFCRPVTYQNKRKVIVNVGPRQLEQGETETLKLCMKEPKTVLVNTDAMLFRYTVDSRREDSLFKKKTTITLTPGPRKPAIRSAVTDPAEQIKALQYKLQSFNMDARELRSDLEQLQREAERIQTFGQANPFFAPGLRQTAAAVRTFDASLSKVLFALRDLVQAAKPDQQLYELAKAMPLEAQRLAQTCETDLLRNAEEIENIVRRVPPQLIGYDAAYLAGELNRNADSLRWVAADIAYNTLELERRTKP